ncbi:MAG: hypothetical protein IKN87_03235 [Bacilli bacterium]|nr:hypothetical protein [Bacilli bacterium]
MKKYLYVLPTILTDMFLVFIGICWMRKFDINDKLLIIICAIFALPILIHIIQTILDMLDSIKNKRIIWLPILLLFNIIILPYYTNKYVLNKIVLKNSIITYAVSAIFLCALMGLYAFTIVGKNTELKLSTIDGKAEFKLDTNWKKKDLSGYSLYAENNKKNMAFGVSTFDLKIFEGYTADGILEDQVKYLEKTVESTEIIKDIKEINENDKTIKTVSYKVKEKNKENYSIFILSVISFKDNTDYVLYVFEQSSEKKYNKNKKELEKIVKEVKLK